MLNVLLLYLAVINITAYFLMFWDKRKAIKQQWRIAEKNFFILCFLGGFIGIYLGMKQFHHKTKHLSFHLATLFAFILYAFFVFYFIK